MHTLPPGAMQELGNVQEFFYTGAATNTNFQIWRRPKWAKMIYIFAVGGAGSGGGGFTASAVSNRGGGGGGGSASSMGIIIPAFWAPEILYISIGPGGAAVGAGTTGNNGTGTFICPLPDTGGSIICRGGQSNGGQAGTGSGGGAGGGGGSIISNTQGLLFGSGVWSSQAGATGAAGGAHTGANGTSITYVSSGALFCPGAGGGGVAAGADFTGGSIAGRSNQFPTLAAGIAAGGAGNHGIYQFRPFAYFLGGSGGGTNSAATGGAGGNGAMGCGGGGGGGGLTGGGGGAGGPGYALIACW